MRNLKNCLDDYYKVFKYYKENTKEKVIVDEFIEDKKSYIWIPLTVLIILIIMLFCFLLLSKEIFFLSTLILLLAISFFYEKRIEDNIYFNMNKRYKIMTKKEYKIISNRTFLNYDRKYFRFIYFKKKIIKDFTEKERENLIKYLEIKLKSKEAYVYSLSRLIFIGLISGLIVYILTKGSVIIATVIFLILLIFLWKLLSLYRTNYEMDLEIYEFLNYIKLNI